MLFVISPIKPVLKLIVRYLGSPLFIDFNKTLFSTFNTYYLLLNIKYINNNIFIVDNYHNIVIYEKNHTNTII